MQIADTTNLATFTTAAARDFVSGTTSNISGYKILTGNTIGNANRHIKVVINTGLLTPSKAEKPINTATIVIKMIDILKHF